MPITRFPDPRKASEGVVAVGGDLHPDSLRLAYRSGIFPWPHEDYPLLWFSPDPRAILDFADLHVPRSLAKAKRRAQDSGCRFTLDQAFAEVIELCGQVPRAGQSGTWITPEMKEAYVRLHRLGHAHSVELWREDLLIGGIYGVDAGGAFAGESMFHVEPNASKLALLHLVEHLRERGLDWLDIQMLTPHMEALGAKEIPRDRFLERLKATLKEGRKLF
ncbi:MAG TPA: leucyl/phenylalanyl-tRNA--protein transferase [Bdellovibrionota bacterium]|nr:leucyl/phenylalanyl-tRNA--protein transferase [Bdellovibrionota bacterium]